MAGRSAKFSAELMSYLWSCAVAPAPAELAGWIETHEHRPTDWQSLCERLRAWPPGKPYPPIPDDEALRHGFSNPDRRWWQPGAKPGFLDDPSV